MFDESVAAWKSASARRLADDGALDIDLAEEVPVAFSYGGIPHAVMMATPLDLRDFAVGFTITDGLAADREVVRDVAVSGDGDGVELEITLTPDAFHRFLRERRRRSLRGHASCGVCGVESREDVPSVGRRLPPGSCIDASAIREAVRSLRSWQPLGRTTRATHAAMAVSARGAIAFGREDVGRHNALDKLIGAAAQQEFAWTNGFCLITSRCSFEMVQKSVAAGITTLVALSAPTGLAVRLARQAGLTLVGMAAGERQITFAG